MMSRKRFLLDKLEKDNAILSVKITDSVKDDDYFIMTKETYEDDIDEIVGLLNKQQATIERLEEKRRYWKSKAMTLLMQVRRLTPRMSAKEVIEFSKELEDE